MTYQASLKRLKEGNNRFAKDILKGELQDNLRRNTLVQGQEPFAIILGCADSRVIPEIIFDTGLGELFTVRVAGNIANSSSIASIEYAVVNLGTKLIVVLGHQNCGAVTAAIKGGDNGTNLNHLLGHILPAIKKSKQGASINEITKINAELTALELIKKSTIIKTAIDLGTVKIISAYYHLDSGKVDFMNE